RSRVLELEPARDGIKILGPPRGDLDLPCARSPDLEAVASGSVSDCGRNLLAGFRAQLDIQPRGGRRDTAHETAGAGDRHEWPCAVVHVDPAAGAQGEERQRNAARRNGGGPPDGRENRDSTTRPHLSITTRPCTASPSSRKR